MSPEEQLAADPVNFARQIVLRRLTDQPRSRADLEQTLAKKNVPAEVAGDVLDRMEVVGLVNDAEFAKDWVRSRQRSKGLSARLLALELRRKGIDDGVARGALEQVDHDAEAQAAHRLVQRKLRSMHGLDRQTQIRRLAGMLARKGYPSDIVFAVVREELDAEPPPHDL